MWVVVGAFVGVGVAVLIDEESMNKARRAVLEVKQGTVQAWTQDINRVYKWTDLETGCVYFKRAVHGISIRYTANGKPDCPYSSGGPLL